MTPALILVGALSVYYPGDHHSGSTLACGGRFEPHQAHLALRQWRGLCGARVRVCAAATGRCEWTTVRDAGPFGMVCDGRWRVWTRHRLPPGCRRRAIADLTRALWLRLGRPRFLSPIRIEVYREPAPTT